MKICVKSNHRVSSEHGVALILTLSILALVTLLAIAFAVSMRTENSASKNFNDLIKARQLAQAAVDDAVARIADATPIPSAAKAWVVAPGAIISTTGGGVFTTNALYTDAVGTGITNLNDNLLVTGSNDYYYSFANAAITPSWQNVTATIGGVPELVGRFAYWTDAESTKIDINQAGLRTAPNPTTTTGVVDPLMNQSAPSDIDLRALESPFYESIGVATNFIAAHSTPPAEPWFSTVEEMQRGLAPPSTTYGSFTSNKFFITVGSVDTNTDALGRARIDLQALNSTAATAYTDALSRFTDASWATLLYPAPIITGANTLAAKYGTFGAHQILANIIDYQRFIISAPTGNQDADVIAAGFAAPALDADGIPNYFSGLKKGPMIDEVIVHVATNAVPDSVDPINQTNLEVRVFVDVKLINGYEINRGNGYTVEIALQADPTMTFSNAPAGTPAWAPSPTTTDQIRTLGGNIPAHGFGLLGSVATPVTYKTTILGNNPSTAPPALASLTVKLQHVKLLKLFNPIQIVDWMAQMDFDQTFTSTSGMQFPNATLVADFVPFDAPSTTNSPSFTGPAGASFKPISMFKQDIRTRTFPGYGLNPGVGQLANNSTVNLYTNWSAVASTNVTPTNIQTYSSRVSPEVYGLLADLRSIEPGTLLSPQQNFLIDQIKEGQISNIGELCYIHTGYPWRTLRLRSVVPETNAVATPYYDRQIAASPYVGVGDANTADGAHPNLPLVEQHSIPDWFLLDIFKIGNASTFSGRVNLNDRFSGPAATLRPRLLPLIGLINNTSSNLSTYFDSPPLALGSFGTNVDIIATNIAGRVFVPGSPYNVNPVYLTPGEICEVQSLGYFSDTVSSLIYNNNPSKTRRQQLIRRISNLVTTRSNLFSIWAIAQSIKEPKGAPGQTLNQYDQGVDIITGTVKVHAIVERYEEGGQVKFRTKYYRYIYE